MKICGFWGGHDCSFCILENGIPTIHVEYERYLREKEPPGDSIQFMKDVYGNDNAQNIKYGATCYPLNKYTIYKESLGWFNDLVDKIFVIGHHQSHAANVFFSSNFDDALIATFDGGGIINQSHHSTAATLWSGKDNKISLIRRFKHNNLNIGSVWTRSTRYIFKLQSGWPFGHQAGTVMSMAALGCPKRFHDDFYLMLTRDMLKAGAKPYDQPKGAYVKGKDPIHPYLNKWSELADQDEQVKFDLAAGLQSATESRIKEIMDVAIHDYRPNNICLSGGVVLNSLCMGKLHEWYGLPIYISPLSNDAGLSLGSAQYVWHQELDCPRVKWEDNCTPYLGKSYSEEDILGALRKNNLQYDKIDVNGLISHLENQKVVALYGGKAESGKRALGNRSIVSDPRNSEMKNIINNKVKHRQWFRPFAPSILREEVKNWFIQDIDSPYMNFVLSFKKEVRDKVPAVVHFDGTARLQTVTKNDNPWYYNFLKQWHKASGVPMILNTSFNDREPICETPEHAIKCFLKTDIYCLYFYDYNLLICKNKVRSKL